MKRSVSLLLSTVALSSLTLAAAFVGCSSSGGETAPPPAECKQKVQCNPDRDNPADLENPPYACGPIDSCEEKCPDSKIAAVSTCPSDNDCMAPVKQSGDVSNLRMGRVRLFAPDSLVPLTKIAIDPNVNPKCFANGADSFSWLMQIDRKANTLKTGGARKSEDAKTYSFVNESVDASKLSDICPGFSGPKDPVSLAPVTSKITFTGSAFTTDKIPLVNVPIFESTTPIILPLREAYLKNVTLSADGTCIGKWDRTMSCNGDSLGWTTAGAIIARITVEDADHVPVKTAGCQSLCAILVNDATKTTNGGKNCKMNADGKTYPEIGDSCVGGASCKNAFRLAAAFGAYGITITGSTPPPTDGGETGAETTGETGGDATSDAPSDVTGDATGDASTDASGG